ncbi:MAG: response regulator [Lachnospiraceae bacterium]|nr:response regulator [Lachnospiraceae bacterium]
MGKIMRTTNVRRRVLVVDDEMINREILGNMLQGEYDVAYAENGQVALDILREADGAFSLILLDLLMPVMGGEEVLKICK